MDTAAARRQMVDQQIRTWEVLDERVLDALGAIPREAFAPAGFEDLAFADAPIPIGFGQTMLAPKMHGRILQSLAINPIDSVLEIGTGTGYLAACLALLARKVKSIDVHPEFVALARRNLAHARGADVEIGLRDAFAPGPLGEFDVIAVTGSMPVYDARFAAALAPGGRLFAIVGAAPVMEAILVRRVSAAEWTRESLFETVVEPLTGSAAPNGFVF